MSSDVWYPENDPTVSTPDFTQLKELLESHGRVLVDIQREQRDFMQLLRGNPIDPSDRGLLGRIEDMEGEISTVKSELQKHREFGQRVVWTFGGAIAVLTFLVGVLAWVAEIFIK